MYKRQHEWKSACQIVSRFNVVTRKAGKVFDADQIDFAALDLLHHLRELRPVKVRAGITEMCIRDRHDLCHAALFPACHV